MSYSEKLKPIFQNKKLSLLSAKQQSVIMNIFIIESNIEQLEWVKKTIGAVPALTTRLDILKNQLFKLTNKYDSKTLYEHLLRESKLGR